MKIRQTPEGVVVLYPGRVVSILGTEEKRHRCCPGCGWGPASRNERYASSRTAYYFRCQKCIDPTTGQPRTWKET